MSLWSLSNSIAHNSERCNLYKNKNDDGSFATKKRKKAYGSQLTCTIIITYLPSWHDLPPEPYLGVGRLLPANMDVILNCKILNKPE